MSTAIQILKSRLAAGEIGLDEYRALLAVISTAAEGGLPTTESLGAVLAEVDDVKLYQSALSSGGKIFGLDSVKSVAGGSSSSSINYIPMDKSTWLTIRFISRDMISLREQRTYFAGGRHKAIATLYGLVRRATFQSRLNNLAAKLVREKRIEIYHPYTGKDEAVFLTSGGDLETATKTIGLKAAKANGMFGVGTEWRSLGFSRGYDTNEVIVCEKKGTLGFIPRSALRFNANEGDTDVINALLIWLADPNNALGG